MRVSIVLPVFNVASYLPKCLESLCAQTLSDIEIICVNDGSTDNSLAILQQYAAKDKRIVVIDQANSGPGIARNQGIAAAKGDYIGFVDPDDWFESDMYEKMYNAAVQNDADLVECGVITHNEITGKTKLKLNLYPSNIFKWQDNPLYVFQGVTAAWNKLCRAEMLRQNNVAFSEGFCAEDHIFTVALRLSANKVVYINQPFYHYLIRSTSLTQKPSKTNLLVPRFMGDVAALLQEKQAAELLESYFTNDAASLAAIHYNKTPHENRAEYRQICAQCLTPKAYSLFEEFIKPYSFKDKLFSIRYKIKGVQKYKVICILGIKLKLKIKN